MRCPNCHHQNTQMTDSRKSKDGLIGRRYHCNNCRKRFFTQVQITETVESEEPGKHTTYSLLNSLHASDARNGVPNHR
jgi:transcriptional regulator NrdR family protein